jgi:hypothetical protein
MKVALRAITTLYNEGLYNDADDAFVTAVREAFSVVSRKQHLAPKSALDLHGMNVAARIVPSELHTTRGPPLVGIERSFGTTIWLLLLDKVVICIRMRPVLRQGATNACGRILSSLSTAQFQVTWVHSEVPSEDIDAYKSPERAKGVRC